MRIELINTGTELLLGRVLNTNQQWLCRQLADAGYTVERQVSVPDRAEDIQDAVREALLRADVVLTTGGLGPTSDDRTRDLIAQLLDRALVMNADVRESIKHFFTSRRRPQPPQTEVQALVPEGAIVLPNKVGTAPGLAIGVPAGEFRAQDNWLIMLPGPPHELRPIFLDSVLPLIQKSFSDARLYSCRTLRSTGLGESVVEARIAPLLKPLLSEGLEIGYCARPGEVDVRLGARGSTRQDTLERAESIVRGELQEHVFAIEDDTLEAAVVRLLADAKQTVGVAESCTGGLLAHRLTNVPGASEVFRGGFVPYSNETKQKFIGVSKSALEEHGAVSEAVAREMAQGTRRVLAVDYALATTGIAGPTGGSEAKPVGTVFVALASKDGTVVIKSMNNFGREIFKNVTTQQALDLLRRRLLKSK